MIGSESYWYPALGWFIFWISLVIAVILFAKTKKLFSIFYLASVSLYVFTVGFMIDIYNFKQGSVLLTLIFSAIIFILLGFYLSKSLMNN